LVGLGRGRVGRPGPTLPLPLDTRLPASPVTVGLLFGLATLAYGLCAPLAGLLSDRHGRKPTMAVGLVATLVAFPLIALPSARLVGAFSLVALGVACAFLLSPTLPEPADAVGRPRPAPPPTPSPP